MPLAHARRTLSALAAGLLAWLLTLAAHAANGPQFTLPVSGVKCVNGLVLKIDGRGIDANGYRPLQVEILTQPNQPLVADRQIRLVLDFYRYGSSSTSRVSEVIDLPEGSATVTKTLLVPQSTSWSMVNVEVYEGGEKLLDLSQKYLRWPSFNGWSWTEARPSLLFIDANVPSPANRDAAVQAFQSLAADPAPTYTLPDVRTLLNLFPDISGPGAGRAMGTAASATALTNATAGTSVSDTTLLTLLSTRARAEMLPPAELPERWIELTQYDTILISWPDLQKVAAANPRQLAALRDWVASGPLLIVYGVGHDFAALSELEDLLKLPPLPKADDRRELRGWTAPVAGMAPRLDIAEPGELAQVTPDDSGIPLPPPAKVAAWPGSPPLVHRPLQTGRVVALATDQPFPGRLEQWQALFNAAGEVHWKWFRRMGFSQHQTNNSYWDFLIPGVGKAPAIPFLLLVSLFAVLIGPVNFLLLGRARRLYLLLITVPAAAVLVTGGLFLFAVLADGFGLRMRLRSFTDLDQQSGHAAAWSRQSYYASLAPSQGLIFPADAAVYPIVYEPVVTVREQPTALLWQGEQHLTTGYIASRRASQVMVQRVTTTLAHLAVREGKSAGEPPEVSNHLGSKIQYVLLCDRRGELFAGEAIGMGGSASLKPTAATAAHAALSRLSADAKPLAEYDPSQANESILTAISSRRVFRPASVDAGLGTPAMTQSILENNLAAALDPVKHPPLPGTYIALVDLSPAVVTGVPRGRQEASLHVVRGRY